MGKTVPNPQSPLVNITWKSKKDKIKIGKMLTTKKTILD
jgi:hypothetical protein